MNKLENRLQKGNNNMRKNFAKLVAASMSLSIMATAMPVYAETAAEQVDVSVSEEIPLQEGSSQNAALEAEVNQETIDQEAETVVTEETSLETVEEQEIVMPVQEVIQEEGVPTEEAVIEEELMLVEEIALEDFNDEAQTGLEGFINRMYTTCLGRNADQGGLDYWVNSLRTGEKKGADVGKFFIQSEELQSKNLSTEAYLDVLYKAFFDRSADAEGKAYWVGQINSGRTKDSVLAEFINSSEFQSVCASYGIERGFMNADTPTIEGTPVQKFVKRFYSKCMNRVPSQGEVDFWVGQLESKAYTGKSFAKYFVSSDEFNSKNLQGEVYIEEMYKIFFDRTPDASGKSFWVNVLASQGKQAIFDGFVSSDEFKASCNEAGIFYDEAAKQAFETNYQNEMVKLINERRKSNGLTEVTIDSSISTIAKMLAKDLSQNEWNQGNSPNYGSVWDVLKNSGIKYSQGNVSTKTNKTTPAQVIECLGDALTKDGFDAIGVGYVVENNSWVIISLEMDNQANLTEEQVAAANESKLIELINVERRKAGLSDFIIESNATEAARLWAGQRAAGKVSNVKDSDGKTKVVSEDYGERGAFVFKYLTNAKGFVENSWTGAKSANVLMNSLKNGNIFNAYGLNPEYTRITVGYVSQKNQWVIFFIK